MYSVLIVDDEPEIVDSLFELLSSASPGQLDILKAYSGREAQCILSAVKIDILLTDIRMPGINGFQLSETAKSNWPGCRVVFLTGYNEFDYAYSAIKSNCEDYLLKTESNGEILRTIEETVKKIEQSLRDEELLNRAKIQSRELLPLMRDKFLLELASGGVPSNRLLKDRFLELGISLNPDKDVYLLLGRPDGLTGNPGSGLYDAEYRAAVRLATEEALGRYSHKALFELDPTTFLCLIQAGEKDEPGQADTLSIIKGAIENIQNICRQSLSLTVSFALGTDPAPLGTLPEKLLSLRKLLDIGAGLGQEAFLTDRSFSMERLERLTSYENDDLKKHTLSAQKLASLSSYLDRGLRKEYFDLLAEITDCLRNLKNKNNHFGLEIYYSIANCLLSYINRWLIADAIAFKMGLYKLTRIDFHDSWQDAVDYLHLLSEEIFKTQKNNCEKMAVTSVKFIKQYTHEHLKEDLSLSRIAELVYFNPSYLSRLFKQVTGMNYSEYLMEVRVGRARELLADTGMLIHEVVEAVGLGSPTYFGRIFKKATGMTPQEYRDTRTKGKNKLHE